MLKFFVPAYQKWKGWADKFLCQLQRSKLQFIELFGIKKAEARFWEPAWKWLCILMSNMNGFQKEASDRAVNILERSVSCFTANAFE